MKKGESLEHAIGNIQSAHGEANIASSTANANPVVTGENNVNEEYRTHVQSIGWQGNENYLNTWFRDGQMTGTTGLSKRLEGIQIVLVPKGGAAPARNYGGVVTINNSSDIKR